MARWVLQIDNADETAEWKKFFGDLLRKLAQEEGSTAAQSKPPNERTYNMVADIGRYLDRHSFITVRQFQVIADIASHRGVVLPETPPAPGGPPIPGGQS